ncbi:MAG: SIR2 family protein, partial [Alphaproteobacteria bacterium]|nr:SIR2 family protein [Alphaproteobacteria bacterium]
MPVDLNRFIAEIDPNNTVLFFGSGSSIPSGAVSSSDLTLQISERFGISSNFALSEAAQLAEIKANRRELISFLRATFKNVRPTGGMSNLPLYDWKRLYTTNYDTIIEEVYEKQECPLAVYVSNFDFSKNVSSVTQRLYKLHGTIQQDHSDGDVSRIVLTSADYDKVRDYREFLFNSLSYDLAGAHLIVIGHSLADPDIIAIVERVIAIQSKLEGAGGKVSLLLYERDDDRALLYETRGINVTFGSVDDFFAQMSKSRPQSQPTLALISGDPLGRTPYLRTVTTDARHALSAFEPKFSAMFSGAAATYSDIVGGYTFDRVIAERITSAVKGRIFKVVETKRWNEADFTAGGIDTGYVKQGMLESTV